MSSTVGLEITVTYIRVIIPDLCKIFKENMQEKKLVDGVTEGRV